MRWVDLRPVRPACCPPGRNLFHQLQEQLPSALLRVETCLLCSTSEYKGMKIDFELPATVFGTKGCCWPKPLLKKLLEVADQKSFIVNDHVHCRDVVLAKDSRWCAFVLDGTVLLDGQPFTVDSENGTLFGLERALGLVSQQAFEIRCKSVCAVRYVRPDKVQKVLDDLGRSELEQIAKVVQQALVEASSQPFQALMRKVRLFDGFTRSFHQETARRLRLRFLQPKQSVLSVGRKASNVIRNYTMFIIYSGRVKFHINGFMVGYLDAPCVFGELQLLAICRDWPVELEADSWACVLELRRADLLMCFSENQADALLTELEKQAREKGEELLKQSKVDPRTGAARGAKEFRDSDAWRLDQTARQWRHILLMNSLQAHPSWRNASKEFLLAMCPSFNFKYFFPNELVVAEDSVGDEVFCVQSGTLSVFVDGKLVAADAENCSFGELCALQLTNRRTATIAAYSTTLVQVLEGQAVLAALKKFPDMITYFHVHSDHLIARDPDPQMLKKHVAFEDTSDEFLNAIAERMDVSITFPMGSVYSQASQKTTGPAMSMVVRGTVELLDPDTMEPIGTTLREGQIFGLCDSLGIDGYVPDRIVVRAVSVVALQSIAQASLLSVLARYPQDRAKVMDAVCEELMRERSALTSLEFFGKVRQLDFLQKLTDTMSAVWLSEGEEIGFGRFVGDQERLLLVQSGRVALRVAQQRIAELGLGGLCSTWQASPQDKLKQAEEQDREQRERPGDAPEEEAERLAQIDATEVVTSSELPARSQMEPATSPRSNVSPRETKTSPEDAAPANGEAEAVADADAEDDGLRPRFRWSAVGNNSTAKDRSSARTTHTTVDEESEEDSEGVKLVCLDLAIFWVLEMSVLKELCAEHPEEYAGFSELLQPPGACQAGSENARLRRGTIRKSVLMTGITHRRPLELDKIRSRKLQFSARTKSIIMEEAPEQVDTGATYTQLTGRMAAPTYLHGNLRGRLALQPKRPKSPLAQWQDELRQHGPTLGVERPPPFQRKRRKLPPLSAAQTLPQVLARCSVWAPPSNSVLDFMKRQASWASSLELKSSTQSLQLDNAELDAFLGVLASSSTLPKLGSAGKLSAKLKRMID